MKLKKIMLITLMLLAVLTIGAVSANDDADFNETLTVEETPELSSDISFDDNLEKNAHTSLDEDILLEDEITEDDFDLDVSSHMYSDADWEPQIIRVWGNDNVLDGSINITVSKDGKSFNDQKSFNGEDTVYWTLDVLKERELGTYTITLKYLKDEIQVDLGEYDFTLTKYNYDTMEGEIYKDYPFDIIRINDEVNAKIYISGKDEPYENPVGWTLSDFEIDSTGEYNIRVITYEDDAEVDNFTFTLNVVDSMGWFRVYSPFEIETDDLENPVIYLYSPDDQIAETIRMFIDDDFFKDVTVESNWMSWTLDDLGIGENGEYDINFENDDGYLCDAWLNVNAFKQLNVDIWDFEEKTLYADSVGTVIRVYPNEDMSGMLDIIVNDTVIFHTIFTSENHEDAYEWDLKSLGITEAGIYNVTLKFVGDGGDEIINEYFFEVVDFDNSTFRAKVIGDDEPFYLYLFTPAGETGIVRLTYKGWDDENEEEVIIDTDEIELDDSYSNKWVMISDYMNYDADRVEIVIGDEEIDVEYSYPKDTGNSFTVNDGEIYSDEDIVLWVYANTTDNDYTINITNGDNSFIVNVMDLGDYEWENGHYKYFITLGDLSSLTFSDKDKVIITYDTGNLKSLAYRWSPAETYAVEKNDDYMMLHYYESIRIDLIKIDLAYNEEEEEQDENYQFDDNQLVRITVPDSLNIHETAIVHITYEDNEITKNISELYNEYNYNNLAIDYYILLEDLDLENLKNKDILNVSVTSADEFIGSRNFIMFEDDEEGWSIQYFKDSIELTFYYGTIGNLEFGQGEESDKIIELIIPEYLNITEGTVTITDENGIVIFSKLLSEFEENCTDYDGQTYGYWISDNVTEFDYSIFKENIPFAVSFAYGNTTKVYARGIREGDELHRITTPENVADYFKVTLSEGILINGSDNAIIIEPTDNANRQSVGFDLGGGYFVVYINGKKVENLGRLVGFDNETELELYLLQRGSGDGSTKLIIYLSDLNITENGEYNIRVTHQPETGATSSNVETEMFNQNITLTSNVKVDNVTSDVLTGFGLDPILFYLDTYYGDISNDVTGNITVLNSDGDEIFKSDIKSLSKDDEGRYYLKYSDFTNKNFQDKITVVYEGNERTGSTDIDVLWKDIETSDFTPVVNDDVNDYYGDFINIQIPGLLSAGQIIVTLKFNGNHTTNLPINVTGDFGSQAVYKFDVAEIKDNYADGFSLSLSDLGFYEDNGDYGIDIKFTADGTNFLNVVNKTANVEFLKDIVIKINETSRYGMELPFATVKIFEPLNAYGELYIDGKLFSHKSFENGLITFISSPKWTVGNHTAKVMVFNSEFGSEMNSSTVEFETLIKTGDVSLNINTEIQENENAIFSITVPQVGNVTVRIDNGEELTFPVNEGENNIDLGYLSKGNHTIWIDYVNNDSTSFYNNYIIITVGDDGSWLDFPDRVELNGNDVVKVDVGEDVEGYILVYIDDKLADNRTLVNGSTEFSLTQYLTGENIYGMHNYTIICYDINGNVLFSRNGTFNVTYIFHDNMGNREVPYSDYYIFIVTLPKDATGQVRITVNSIGYRDTTPIVDGQAIFYIPALPFGEHDIFVEYLGDDKYPPLSYHTIINVSHYGVVGEIEKGKWVIRLKLPENATGNLVIYNDNRATVLYTIPIQNGLARVELDDLTVGQYDIRAIYDAEDYYVKSFTTSFKVMPEVIITQNATIGDDVNIFMDLNNATGTILIVMDGLSPVLQEIVEGKVNYTFSTKDYVYGNHTVYFMYFGDSFDKNIFLELNNGIYDPIEYEYYLTPLEFNATPEYDGGDWLIIDCGNATGNITVFLNGVKWKVVEIVNGFARINLAGLNDGDVLTFEYSGDNLHRPKLLDLLLAIKHKTPSIVAYNLNMDYTSGKAYSVTVYNKEGKPANNAAVTFSINNKVVGNVLTDSKGVASIIISSVPGTYKITTKALDISVTKQLKVNKILSLKKVKVKRSAKKLVLTATLKKVNGKYLKGKKIIFKFKGKKYTAKTNKKGVAKVTIKKNVLKKLKKGKKVTYQATYLKDTVKRTVKVKK